MHRWQRRVALRGFPPRHGTCSTKECARKAEEELRQGRLVSRVTLAEVIERYREAYLPTIPDSAVIMVLIGYPWDFFAIRLGAWKYGVDSGPTLYGVPLNDSLPIWLCSYFTCVLLLRLQRRDSLRHCQAKGEDAREQNARK